jgi:hypothetical protein
VPLHLQSLSPIKLLDLIFENKYAGLIYVKGIVFSVVAVPK